MSSGARRGAHSAFHVHALAISELLHQQHMGVFHLEGPVCNMCPESGGFSFISTQK